MRDRIRDFRMWAKLADQPGWMESLPPDVRQRLGERAIAALERSDKPREVAAIGKLILAMQRADVDIAGLELDAQKTDSGPSADERLREWVRGVMDRRPKPPDGAA